jgi:hypothetical protein
VLGYSRLIWARFVAHQDLQTVLRCPMAAFAALGGVAREILYDRMKTAVIGEDDEAHIVYNRALIDFAGHYRFHMKACRPHRAKRKGKVERPFRYVNEAFAEEKLQPLPVVPFRAVLKLERRVSHEGIFSVGGNLYSVPDTTRKRVVEVHTLADEIRIFEASRLIAVHPVLEGRHQRRVAPGHRKMADRFLPAGEPPPHRSRASVAPPHRRRGRSGLRRFPQPAAARSSRETKALVSALRGMERLEDGSRV